MSGRDAGARRFQSGRDRGATSTPCRTRSTTPHSFDHAAPGRRRRQKVALKISVGLRMCSQGVPGTPCAMRGALVGHGMETKEGKQAMKVKDSCVATGAVPAPAWPSEALPVAPVKWRGPSKGGNS